MRLDKYLKVSRIIKRRTIANEVCDAKKVTVNGKIARASYAMCAEELGEIARNGGGRLGVFRNHSKVKAFYGEKFDGAILSSANVNTNPRTENTVIACQTEVADFYKSFFDLIHPFNHKDFPNFTPWRRK